MIDHGAVSGGVFRLSLADTPASNTPNDNEGAEQEVKKRVSAVSRQCADISRSATRNSSEPTEKKTAKEDYMTSEEQEELIESLKANFLQCSETVFTTMEIWDAIQAALLENPPFMRHLKAHQDMGAQLTVTRIHGNIGEQNCFAEFENVADELDIKKEKRALHLLSKGQIADAVEAIVMDAPAEKSDEYRTSIQKGLASSGAGFNYYQALVLMAAHGGKLISLDSFNSMAEKRETHMERTSTWNDPGIAVMQNDIIVFSSRFSGKYKVLIGQNYAINNQQRTGGRVSGLKIQIS